MELVKLRIAALKNQTAQTASRTENRRLNSLIRISQSLARAVSLDDLIKMIVHDVCTYMDADQVFLLLQDTQGELHIRSEWSKLGRPNRQAVSTSVCSKVLEDQDVLIPEAMNDVMFQSKESVVLLDLRSVMATPIRLARCDVPNGVLYACSYTTGELFGADDLEFLKAFAAIIGVHLQLAELLDEKESKKV
jgi:GAF domain-containing protein